MIINNVIFNADIIDILEELRHQLALNQIPLLQKMKPSGDNVMVSCPYHGNGQERRPSAGIRKSDGLLHCFACGATHTLQEVISYCFGHYEDVFGQFGWDWLLKNFATVAVEERKPIELNLSRQKEEKKIEYVTEEELDKYRYYHPYWTKRGITDERIIELFDLGYDKDTDCITFNCRNEQGKTLFVARRNVRTKWFNYPHDSEKELYGLYELSLQKEQPNEVYVCESMIDALTIWQFGKFAVAMNGLGTLKQFQQLRDMKCRKLILATDNDKAGQQARQVIRQNVKNKIITEIILPEGKKDINELTKEEFENLQEVFS